jgi:hypothetical protein
MEPTRRSFLIKASAGAVGVAGVVGGGLALSSSGSPGDQMMPAAMSDLPDQPVLVQIRDARRGEVAVLVGERELVVTDRALVARVARALR